MSIRGYGAGKFNTILDSLVWPVSMDGIDDEISLGDGEGWFGLMEDGSSILEAIQKNEKSHKIELNEDEIDLLKGSFGVILAEDQNGFVVITYHETEDELNKEWAVLEEEFLPEEEEEEE